jgi:hypothetical protein
MPEVTAGRALESLAAELHAVEEQRQASEKRQQQHG